MYLRFKSSVVQSSLNRIRILALVVFTFLANCTVGQDLPQYLQDRGRGTPTDMFGTYAEKGDLLFYPFFEYYASKDAVYNPQELGYNVDQEFTGKFRSDEWLLYLGYGLTQNIVIALEGAYFVRETQWKASEDNSNMPQKFKESGLGDVGVHIHWLWSRETQSRPAFFSYMEVGLPLQRNRDMIGTSSWEFVPGIGIIKGFKWGTMTGKFSLEYDADAQELTVGETAVEYLKRLSPVWRIYVGVAGTVDEIEFIPEAQWHITESIYFKFNSAIGLTSEAPDWAPEVGVMFIW